MAFQLLIYLISLLFSPRISHRLLLLFPSLRCYFWTFYSQSVALLILHTPLTRGSCSVPFFKLPAKYPQLPRLYHQPETSSSEPDSQLSADQIFRPWHITGFSNSTCPKVFSLSLLVGGMTIYLVNPESHPWHFFPLPITTNRSPGSYYFTSWILLKLFPFSISPSILIYP